jgi:two-component system CheB/CheR fusion protein
MTPPDDDDGAFDTAEVDVKVEVPLRRLLDKLSAEHGFDFREYKLGSLNRRVEARLSQLRIDSLDAYIRHLDRHPEEAEALFDTLLINVTSFFRDPDAWAALREDVVPELLRAAADTHVIRAWCAACSSGEEA